MTRATLPRNNFAIALKLIRKSRGLSQEAFDLVSSRTYVSTLERNMKSPTLNKVDSLAETLSVHPLTLLTLSYLQTGDPVAVDKVLRLVTEEIAGLK